MTWRWGNAMKPTRRSFLYLGAGGAALPMVSRIARAQTYPSRPVRIIVGFGAGSGNDLLAHLMAQSLSQRFGQPFIVDTRPGAGGNIGAEAVVRAAPDGYTLLVAGSPDAINATLYNNLNFNFIRDIAPIAGIASAPNVMVVHPSFPPKSVPEFIAYAKANPGKINMASTGAGSVSHMSGELFKMMAGVNLVHVPYRGQPSAITDLLGGQVQVDFATMPPSIEYVRAGKLRAVAVTAAMRSEVLPDLPTIGDFLPGYEVTAWTGMAAPKNTPAEIVDRLNRGINAALADPKMKARLADLGGTGLPGSPADFGRLIADETEKWAKVVKFSGAKPDRSRAGRIFHIARSTHRACPTASARMIFAIGYILRCVYGIE
jgi:tripartite-type tricarboxylate transporter receptor subunit TctC